MANNTGRNMSDNIDFTFIDNSLTDCPDIIRKKVYIEGKYEAYFIYINGIVDRDLIQRDFIKPVLSMTLKELTDESVTNNIPCGQLKLVYQPVDIVEEIMSGNSVFVSRHLPVAISCALIKLEKRSIEEPETEKNIRGPHESFIEPILSNLSILRRKIKNDKLKFKMVTIGEQTNQKVAIAYIDGIADINIVNDVYKKISEIKIDGSLAIGYIEQIIKTHKLSLFPQFYSTERPDKAASVLLDGGIVILQDGTPAVMTGPVSFISFIQALDDYSTHWVHGSFLRLIRIFALVASIVLPSLYIAITSYHYYSIPLNLLVQLAESRSKVPFPPIVEVLILEGTVEMLREATIRLPTYIGNSISVVAGLIIGQAAVEAGIFSNLLIVIVAATAVASYVIPSYDMGLAVRILRFIFIIATSLFGMIGIVICIGFTFAHLLSMESLGQPYFQPFAPLKLGGFKDALFRLSIKRLKKRSIIIKTNNRNRSNIK